MSPLRWLWGYARPYRAVFAASLAGATLQALVNVPVPFILRHLVDHVLESETALPWWLPPDRTRAVRLLFLGLLAVAVVRGGAAFLRRTLSERAAQGVIFDLRCDLFRHMMRLSMGYFRGAKTGRIMLRFIGDIQAIHNLIRDGFLSAFTDLATLLVVSALILRLDFRLGLATLAVLPVYALCFIRFSPKLREASRTVRDARLRFSGSLHESIAGIAIVKSFNRESAEVKRMRHQTGVMRKKQLLRAAVSGHLTGWAHGLIGISAAVILGYGSTLVLRGEMSRGQLVAFYILAAFLFPPLRRLARVNELYQESIVSLERIFRFFDSTQGAVERPGAMQYQHGGGGVLFRGVTFGYRPEEPVLHDIDLDVRPGEVVAFVGPNGAGKSTLVSVIPRLIDPQKGSVLLDGQDVRDLTFESLRGAIAMVPQDPFLFSGTIEENIRYGRPDATREDILRAVEAAHLEEVLGRLPRGLETEVGERGLKTSGGERQRIVLARAILMDPAILIMDEATSGVDAESESAIRGALERLMHGRTVLLIAHRLATTQRADRIVVMDKGRIVEQGTHAQLMRRQGLYASLCESQLLLTDSGLAPARVGHAEALDEEIETGDAGDDDARIDEDEA